MPLESSEVRVMPVEAPADNSVLELDVSEVRSIVVAEATSWGTSAGEVSIALGDMGQFFDIAPGDNITGFAPVRKLLLRSNVPSTAKKVVLLLSSRPEFRIINTPRSL